MSQRELVEAAVRLIGAYLAWTNTVTLIGECMMPAGSIGMVPGIEGAVLLQLVGWIVGLYLLLSGRALVYLVCRRPA
jgi:hypothetical protein